MMTPTRIIRMIGIAGLVGWMILVGWVAKTSQAQNGAQDAKALPGPTEPSSLTPVADETPNDKAPAPPALGADLPGSRAAEPSVSPNPAAPPARHDAAARGITSRTTSEPSKLHRHPAGIPQRRPRAGSSVVRGAESEGSRGASQGPHHGSSAASHAPCQAGSRHQEVAGAGQRFENLAGPGDDLHCRHARGRRSGRP